MPPNNEQKLVEALHRKLRGVAAIIRDPAATEHERATAAALKTRIETLLNQYGAPVGDWTDVVFRWGRAARKTARTVAPPDRQGDWTDNAFRLGRALRHTVKKLRQD